MEFGSFIQEVLVTASDIARVHFGRVTVTVKPDDRNQVLTETDRANSVFLVGSLRRYFPDHNIIDEEAGVVDNGSEFSWATDPTDGTSNYAAATEDYGIMLAVAHRGIVLAGGIALPAWNTIVVAERGAGAYSDSRRLAVIPATELASVLIAQWLDGNQAQPDQTRHEAALYAELALHCRNMRSSNSCLDIVRLAQGSYGGVIARSSKIWDNWAQQIIVEEAGGLYTDFFGQPMDYSNPLDRAQQNFDFCAAPPGLHVQIQKVIHQVFK